MSDPGLSWPDVCSIRAAAEKAEFAHAARGVLGADGCPPTDGDLPLPGCDRRVPYRRLRRVVDAAPASIPHRSGYPIRQLGTGGASLARISTPVDRRNALGEFEVEAASVPPGDGGVVGEVGLAEDG